MATTTITITPEAYNALKAKKKEGESFSNLILRTFQKSNASEILAYYKGRKPDPELADAVEQSRKKLRKNFKLGRVEL